jgi:hypothetical protein
MHIITVIDYADPNGLMMSRIWLYLVRRYNPDARITVFTGDHAALIAPAAKKAGATLFPLERSGILSHRGCSGHKHVSQDLILSIWRHIDAIKDFGKYIYIEPDAWILSDLSDWWNLVESKPYIAVQQGEFGGDPLFNTGTYSARGDGFMTYPTLLGQYEADRGISFPVGEQGLINAYFKRIGYDCSHPQVGFEYNCWTVGMKTERADDDEIVIVSGDLPPDASAKVRSCSWKWFGHSRRAKILHSFFAKFWELPECKRLWDYLAGKAG